MTYSTADELLWSALEAIPDGRRVAELFAEDGVLELPFLPSIGIPSRYQGRKAIADFYELVRGIYPDFVFKPADTKVHIATGDRVFAEYAAHATAAKTGRRIHHLFMGYLVAERGEITLLREALNVFGGAQALFPAGLAEFPATLPEIHTVPEDYRP